jgi:hypothetical protein
MWEDGEMMVRRNLEDCVIYLIWTRPRCRCAPANQSSARLFIFMNASRQFEVMEMESS